MLYSSGQTVGRGSSSASRSYKHCVLCSTAWFLGELIEVLLEGLFAFMDSKLNFKFPFFLKLVLSVFCPEIEGT